LKLARNPLNNAPIHRGPIPPKLGQPRPYQLDHLFTRSA
jgi:hypothetical protein